MRKFYSLITMLLIVTIASSQNTYTWNNASGGDYQLETNWTPTRSAGIIAASDILLFNLGSSYTVNNIPSQTVGRVNVSAGTVSFAGAALATSLQINNNSGGADLIVADGASLIQTASLETIVLGNAATGDISGTYSITTGATYNANGTNTNAVTTVSSTGIIDNQGLLSSSVADRLAMASGSHYIHAQNGGLLPFAGWDANSTIEFTGVTSSLPGNLNQTYGNFTWNSSLQTATLSFNSAVTTVNGDFSVQNTGTGAITFKNTGAAPAVNVVGDFNLSGGTLFINNTNNTQTLNVQGDVTISGGILTRSGGTANFNFSGTTQTFTKTGGTISNVVNFAINSGATVDFGTSVLDGSTGTFTLAIGGKIITANADGIRSTGAFGAIQVTGTRTYNSVADYEFRGASTGIFTTSTNPQVRNFTVNNTTGNVTLSQPMIVNGVLTLTDGELNTSSTNILNLADGATVAGVSNASFINGPIRKTGDDAFTFPTGRSGAGYVPIAISAPASTTTVMTAEYLRGIPPNANNITATGITHISGCDYWTLDHTAGTAPTINITLNWNANNPCGGASYVTDPTTIKAVHYNGTSWNTASLANGTGTAAVGSVTWTGVSVFSPFALGTTATGNNNPLPVLFDNVRAFEKSGGIQIEWSNLTERDLIEYVVERSLNGRDYFEYSSIAPKSNQNDKADYTEFDAAPSKGANFYRIRVLAQGGKNIYSKVLRVDIGGSRKGFSIYPNPVIGKQVNLALTGVKQGTYNVRVVTTTGQDVFQKSIMTQASGITQTLVLPSTLKPGIYNLLVSGEGYSQNQLFIVQ
jgi:hypothetical protein